MKHSFWLVNSLLLVLLCCTFIFMFFSQQRVNYTLSLEPQVPLAQESYATNTIQTRLIYENDLFNTYHKTFTAPTQPTYVESSLPQPPSSALPEKPPVEQKKFLPSLKIKLKGIIAVDDQSLNRVVIADEQTQEQKNYKIGDIVEDGLLIKIFPNKAVFLRSNGQQEILYLDERDIEEDPLISQQKKYWVNIIQHLKDNEYALDHIALKKSVQNISTLFDLFNVTTVYDNGNTKGLRVGQITPRSLGSYLGLESQDLVTECLDVPLTSLSNQRKCYSLLDGKDFGDSVTITIERNNKSLKLSYVLRDLKDPFDTSLQNKKSKNKIIEESHEEELKRERIKLLKKKYKFAPTAQDLRIQQKLVSGKKNIENSATLKKKE